MTFSEIINRLDWEDAQAAIPLKTGVDVEKALSRSRRSIDDFIALISPAADAYLPEMVERSHALTRQRFGNGMNLFVPLYLSNTCANDCSYCGFSMSNAIKRITLDEAEVEQEVEAIKSLGVDNLLLVTGETRRVSMPYFERMLPLIRPHFSHLAMEVQPLETDEYRRLRELGLDAVMIYQETYNRISYTEHHTRGNKSNFNYRLDTPDRLGQAQVHKIGLGVLLGLSDWRTDSLFMAHHLRFLQKRYWRSKFSISFPRIRPCAGGTAPRHLLSDRQLVQLVCAWRLFDPDLELTLSTRESSSFRDNLMSIGFTSMSAEASTRPGGYADKGNEALEQFEIADPRTFVEIREQLRQSGLEAIDKDWDRALTIGSRFGVDSEEDKGAPNDAAVAN